MALIDYKKYSSEIKTLTIAGIGIGMWYDLKTDFAVHQESHKLVEFRISALENKLALNASSKPYALLPKSTEIETEEKNNKQ